MQRMFITIYCSSIKVNVCCIYYTTAVYFIKDNKLQPFSHSCVLRSVRIWRIGEKQKYKTVQLLTYCTFVYYSTILTSRDRKIF